VLVVVEPGGVVLEEAQDEHPQVARDTLRTPNLHVVLPVRTLEVAHHQVDQQVAADAACTTQSTPPQCESVS
jgi:hypothetical protein